jgi:hypothetical protein
MDADLRLWLRLLSEIEQIGVPTKIGDYTPQFELRAIKEMIEAGWLNGSVLPPVGSPILSIYITDITRVARKAVQDNEPSERRRSFFRNNGKWLIRLGVTIALAIVGWWFAARRPYPPAPESSAKDKSLSPQVQESPVRVESLATPIPSPGIP